MNGLRGAVIPAILLGVGLWPSTTRAQAAKGGAGGGLAGLLIAYRDVKSAPAIHPAALTAAQYRALLQEEARLRQQEAAIAGQLAGAAATVRGATTRVAGERKADNLLLARGHQVATQLARIQAQAAAQHAAALAQEAKYQQQERQVARQLASNLALIRHNPRLAGQYRSGDAALTARDRQLSSQLAAARSLDTARARALAVQEQPLIQEKARVALQESAVARSITLDGQQMARGLQLENSLTLQARQVAAQRALAERQAATPSAPGR